MRASTALFGAMIFAPVAASAQIKGSGLYATDPEVLTEQKAFTCPKEITGDSPFHPSGWSAYSVLRNTQPVTVTDLDDYQAGVIQLTCGYGAAPGHLEIILNRYIKSPGCVGPGVRGRPSIAPEWSPQVVCSAVPMGKDKVPNPPVVTP